MGGAHQAARSKCHCQPNDGCGCLFLLVVPPIAVILLVVVVHLCYAAIDTMSWNHKPNLVCNQVTTGQAISKQAKEESEHPTPAEEVQQTSGANSLEETLREIQSAEKIKKDDTDSAEA